MSTALPLGDRRSGIIEHFIRPRPSRWRVEVVIPVAFIITAVAIGAAATLVWHSLSSYRESSQLVAHTHAVLETIERVFSSIVEASGSTREYVITQNPDMLRARDGALTQLNDTISELQMLTSDNSAQQVRVADLRTLVSRRVEIMIELRAERDRGGFEAARQLMLRGTAAKAMQDIRDKLNEMSTLEHRLLSIRLQQDEKNNRQLTLSSAALMAIVSLTVIFTFWKMWRELAARRALTSQLEESRHFFQSVFENIPNMVFIKDAHDFRYVAFNAAAEQLMKNPRTAVLGKTDFDLMPEKIAEELARREREIVREGATVDIPQEVVLNPAGEQRIMHTRKAVISNTEGKPLYLIGISEDVTDRVRVEQQIQALNDVLLVKAEALEAANKELESFCYSVSHDLRAPLRAVNSYALMLEEDHAQKLDDEAKRFIKTIRDGANRMGRLIEDLLAFSRLGRTPIKLERLDSNALVARATREVMEQYDGASPQIAVHELPIAQGDPSLLYQVWTNLIGNAVKYSSKVSTPRIEIGGILNGHEAMFYIKDNGAGFDMKYVNKLFGVFQRLHGQDEFPGTGVGLAIVHRVITRHGGRIWAESEPGKGATFSFTLARGEAV